MRSLALAIFFFLFIGSIWGDNNILKLRITPSLAASIKDETHSYHVSAYCIFGPITENERAFVTEHSNDEDIITINFKSEFCDDSRVEVRMIRVLPDLSGMAWANPYGIGLNINETNHRILFGNYFHLSITPELPNDNLYYQVRVFCHEQEAFKKAKMNDIWNILNKAGKFDEYSFKTFTKSSTMVVFNSELRQCNTYHVKVWATPLELKNEYPDALPLVHYVCHSNGNGEKRQISFASYFNLQIIPELPEEEDSVYYVEAKCHGSVLQPFSTLTKSETMVVQPIPTCISYDLDVQKVPLKKIKGEEKEGDFNKQKIYSDKVLVAKGQTYTFNLEKQSSKRRRMDTMEKEGHGFSQKRLIPIKRISDNQKETIEISDDDESEEDAKVQRKEKKSEQTVDECFIFAPIDKKGTKNDEIPVVDLQ